MTAEAPAAFPAMERFAKSLFLATIVTGSFLLFLTQPMIARMALPRLGGAPAVWNSAMLVYQALLLGGYAYAHWLARLRPRRQAGLHLALFGLAALWLPIGLADAIPPSDFSPVLWVPWFLVSSIGPLFFIISAQAPLMQRWFALESSRGEPYALYAASNLGSFGGLISYPLIVEPLLTLDQQSQLWTAGYALLVLLVVGCALTIPGRTVEAVPLEASPAPGRKRVLHWIALAAVPSGLMLSTTTHLTTDIVAMPLLWALPLGLYLLSFVVAFANARGVTLFITQIAPLVILIGGGLAFADGSRHPLFSATIGLSLLFVVAVTLHGEMYRLRPAPDRLTGFYLTMSVGGVIGGAFCAVAAPTIFDWAYEHPLLIIAAALLTPQRSYIARIERIWSNPVWRQHLTLGLPVLAILISLGGDRRFMPSVPADLAIAATILIALLALFSIGQRAVFAVCLGALMMSYGGWSTLQLSMKDVRTRSYFGVYTVGRNANGTARMLTHGTTVHGLQNMLPGMEEEPTSYYTRGSGVGRVMASAERLFGPEASMGVVGLGTGTLACYARPDQRWTFFEIDPAMVNIATDPRRFSFVSRCAPQARIVLGDARLSLTAQPPQSLDILAVDAFSSDAVPMHLLTREALGVYARVLKPGGVLMMHISNRYLKLEPVIDVGARSGGWHAGVFDHKASYKFLNDHSSVWVAMTRDGDTMRRLSMASGAPRHWRPLERRPGFPGWSDDYASILPLLRGLDWK
ncbi:MAG TPA: fused MFS/spermidine synthase [Allosphingosinicella sp.]|nr:fused MFS/spermidine synthase [Allosphingosinicella sp.]